MDLRIRITDELQPPGRRIEVLDRDGQVIGDLAKSVSEVRWVATGSQLAIVSIDLAAERSQTETLELSH